MSISSIRLAMQTLNRAVSGVTTAPAEMPLSIGAIDCPILITWPTEGAWSQQAVGLKRQERAFTIRAYVAPIAQGKGIDEKYDVAEALLQALGLVYAASATVASLGVDHIESVTDTGLAGHLEWGGVQYRGFEMTVKVVEKQ